MDPESRYAAKYKKLKRVDGRAHAREINFTCFQERPFLRSERACNWFVDSAIRAIKQHEVRLWAYVIMPTHVHLVVYPRRLEMRMASFLFSLKRSVTEKAIYWTKEHAPDGLRVMLDLQPNGSKSHRFWQRGGGYDRNLWSDKAIWDMIDYLHCNPVEAGLCKRPADWRWSSAAYYESKTPGPLQLDLEHLPFRP